MALLLRWKRSTASQNVSAGQYVIVKNSTITGITDGLYTSRYNISANTIFTASDLVAVTNGGLNDLLEDVTTLNDQIGTLNTVEETTANVATGRTLSKNYVRKYNRDIEVILQSDSLTPSSNGWINIATLPVGDTYRPYSTIDFAAINNADDSAVHGRIENGVVMVYGKNGVSIAPIVHVKFTSKS